MSEEEEEDPGESAGQNGAHDEGKRDLIVELFIFTRSMSYYTSILEQLLVAAGSGATIVFTSTSHPGSSVSAVQPATSTP